MRNEIPKRIKTTIPGNHQTIFACEIWMFSNQMIFESCIKDISSRWFDGFQPSNLWIFLFSARWYIFSNHMIQLYQPDDRPLWNRCYHVLLVLVFCNRLGWGWGHWSIISPGFLAELKGILRYTHMLWKRIPPTAKTCSRWSPRIGSCFGFSHCAKTQRNLIGSAGWGEPLRRLLTWFSVRVPFSVGASHGNVHFGWQETL